MTATVKHKFVSPKGDSADPTIVQPSNWNDDHTVTLDPLAGTRNKVINGLFNIWQRKTDFPSATGVRYSADRWRLAGIGSQIGLVGSNSNGLYSDMGVGGELPIFSFTSVAGNNNNAFVDQAIEGVHTLSGKQATLTFSARRWSGTATKIGWQVFQYFGNGGSPSPIVVVASGVETFTSTMKQVKNTFFVPSVEGKSFGTNGDNALYIRFYFDAGSTAQSFGTPAVGRQSGSMAFTKVSLVEGDATGEDDPFPKRHIQLEYILCCRYYQRARFSVRLRTSTIANDYIAAHLNFPEMRAPPALSVIYTGVMGNIQVGPSLWVAETNGVTIDMIATSANTDTYVLNRNYGLDAEY